MDKALEHEHKAYELSVKVQGEEHQDTMDILFVLTNLYKDAGDIDKALEYGNKILSLLGEGHPDTQKVSDWLQSFAEED